MQSKQCHNCGNIFVPKNSVQRFCSNKCKRAKYNEGFGPYGMYQGISSGTVGAISELKVAVDLMSRGFEVLRAISPNCSCDLAVLFGHLVKKIEVRTGYYSVTGKIVTDRKMRADVLAIVLPDRIVYEPELS